MNWQLTTQVLQVPGHARHARSCDSDSHSRTRPQADAEPANKRSNGIKVQPASAMNPDFEYFLPPHLALIAHSAGALPTHTVLLGAGSESRCKTGDTVVAAPYTVGSETDNNASLWAANAAASSAKEGLAEFSSVPSEGVDQVSVQDPAWGPTAHENAPKGRRAAPEDQEHSALGNVLTGGVTGGAAATAQHRCNGIAPFSDTSQHTAGTAARGSPERRLQQKLDSFGIEDLFLGRYELLGRHHRRYGGAPTSRCCSSARM